MPSKVYTIHPSELPTRIPVVGPAVLWLLLDNLGAPVWLKAVVMTLAALWFLFSLLTRSLVEVPVRVLVDGKPPEPKAEAPTPPPTSMRSH